MCTPNPSDMGAASTDTHHAVHKPIVCLSDAVAASQQTFRKLQAAPQPFMAPPGGLILQCGGRSAPLRQLPGRNDKLVPRPLLSTCRTTDAQRSDHAPACHALAMRTVAAFMPHRGPYSVTILLVWHMHSVVAMPFQKGNYKMRNTGTPQQAMPALVNRSLAAPATAEPSTRVCLMLQRQLPGPCTPPCAAARPAADTAAHSSGLCGNLHKYSCAPTPAAPLWAH
jgi:hypothetical protein